MSREEAVLVVSRAFSLLLITWLLVDVTYLPQELLGLGHHMSQRSVLATQDYQDYWSNYYLVGLIVNVVRIVALLFAARLFWKRGPSVEAVFVLKDREPSLPSDPE